VDGIPLVRRTVLLIAEVCEGPVTVVTGADADQVEESLVGLDVLLTPNPEWREGLARSLAVGLRSLGPGCDAALVAPCDLPALSATDLARLTTSWRDAPDQPAAARYNGIIGVPAVLPARLFPAIATLTGDRGARDLLRRSEAPITTVEFPSAATDLDDGRDLAALADRKATIFETRS